MCMKKTERPSTLPAKTIIIIGRVIASLLGLHFAFFSFFDWGPKNMRSYMLRLSTVKETWKYLNCIRNYNSPKWPHRSVFGNYIYWLSTGFRKRQGRVQFVCVIISNLRHAYCIFESLTLVLIRPFRVGLSSCARFLTPRIVLDPFQIFSGFLGFFEKLDVSRQLMKLL